MIRYSIPSRSVYRALLRSVYLLALLVWLQASIRADGDSMDYWPQWRGPLSTGEAPNAAPPIRWSEQESIRWKVLLPGRGNGTPIVWGDLVFVLTAEEIGPARTATTPSAATEETKEWMRKTAPSRRQRLSVVALRRQDGTQAWNTIATEVWPHEEIHQNGTWAAGSAVTDGEHLIASFGSYGLYAFDLSGNLVWEKKLGPMRRDGFGEGVSPALHGDTVVVQRDHLGQSSIVAFDKATGEERWRRDRDEPVSWASPLVVEIGGQAQVLTSGSERIRAYDLRTGSLLWQCGGLTSNAIASPVYRDGVAYFMTGFQGSALLAIRIKGAKGDITKSSAVMWRQMRDTPYVPSPLLLSDRLYFLKTNTGILSALDPMTGVGIFVRQRLAAIREVFSSPVAAAGRIYLTGRDGTTEVLAHGPVYSPLAVNRLEDSFSASAAIAGDELYLRGDRYLYCIAPTGD